MCSVTNIFRIVFDVVDGVFNEIDGFIVGFVALPVTSDHSFVAGEEVAREHTTKHDKIL